MVILIDGKDIAHVLARLHLLCNVIFMILTGTVFPYVLNAINLLIDHLALV